MQCRGARISSSSSSCCCGSSSGRLTRAALVGSSGSGGADGGTRAWRATQHAPQQRQQQQQQQQHRRSRTSKLRVQAVNYDPENLFKGVAPKEGIIERRLMAKEMGKDQKFAAAVAMAQDEDRKKVLLRRQSRSPPTDHVELIEFFLNTQADDMEFEVARCRPQLTPEFFKQLDTLVGQERFAPKPDEDRLTELETLRSYLEQASKAVDAAVAQNISAVERMKKLLTAPDKKAMILEMAEANEIDVALLDLLQQNIAAAKEAGQTEPAEFMEKVRQAAMKFMVSKA